ncbi:urease accessory protein UreE [Haloarcula nitratireducens]|uniref:Urease accessory protein UreE n=1 Tax=Haloarcula nitratireducens TaxID=2487749 RepID=A0AAW4PBZ5_9EURY|nr:urease accessory protein UreE [Halomicroarcula nitratireducens]MBX0295226.1 urease accessory protein UreE [Halomicroarcula nitratireducens]
MYVADSYLGHREDSAVADRLAEADQLRVVLSDTDRRRSRLRTETTDGEDLGIVVARDLADGDVLETDDGTLVAVELAAIDALVLDFAEADVSAAAALELGHALGNRHWDLAVRGEEALFPVPDTRERMDAAVADLLPEDVTTRYERVPPTTFDDGDDHGHGEDGHAHGHGDHTHSHSHGSHDGADRGYSRDHAHGVRTIDGDGE